MSTIFLRAKDWEKEKLEFDKVYAVRYLINIFRFFGLWPNYYKNKFSKNTTSKLQIFHVCIIYIPFLLTFCVLMWIEGLNASDLQEAGRVIYITLPITLSLVKIFIVRVLMMKFVSFFRDLENNLMFDILTPEEAQMWSKNQKRFFIVSFLYIGSSILSGMFGYVGVLFSEEYELGFPYYVPFEWRMPERYWYVYSYDVSGVFICCISNTSIDMLGCYMIFHIGLLYKLLGLRLQKLRLSNEVVVIKELRKLYLMHSNIKRITCECEALISYNILFQILASSIVIGLSAYRVQSMNILAEIFQFISMLQFVCVMILEIYLPCHYVNQLTENSAELMFHIYDCNWMQFSVSSQKFVRLYMEFFKKPVYLRAGKFFEISLLIFSKVMNNAYSYFALLLNMNE